jgi:hypothetical protein
VLGFADCEGVEVMAVLCVQTLAFEVNFFTASIVLGLSEN